jgi:hypothetical protein
MDLAYQYRWGIGDVTLDWLDYQDDNTPATNQCVEGGSVAILQGQGVVSLPAYANPTLSPEGSFITGQAWYTVTDETIFAGATEIYLMPTWARDAFGIGPYIDWNVPVNAKTGSGVVIRGSTNERIPFDLFTEGHSRLKLRMQADGTVITATNPFSFVNGDTITAFWNCFVYNWD